MQRDRAASRARDSDPMRPRVRCVRALDATTRKKTREFPSRETRACARARRSDSTVRRRLRTKGTTSAADSIESSCIGVHVKLCRLQRWRVSRLKSVRTPGRTRCARAGRLRDRKPHERARRRRLDGGGAVAGAESARGHSLETAVDDDVGERAVGDGVGVEALATASVVVVETGAGEGDELEGLVVVAKSRVVGGI